jgi:hypothetical protein
MNGNGVVVLIASSISVGILGEKNLVHSNCAQFYVDPAVRRGLPIMQGPSTGNSRTAM